MLLYSKYCCLVTKFHLSNKKLSQQPCQLIFLYVKYFFSYFQYIDFRPLDEEYGWRNNYVQKLMIIESLRNFSNEKKCFQQLVPYYLNPFVNSECHNANDLIEFFNQNKEKLYFSCHVTDIYSHCQEFYVVTYDTMKDTCSSYFRKPCMINDQKE